ncbi:DNA-directed RNA polymerase, beta subunit [Candidatus Scalindua japonica]|uniref:DNA-directed RNA polymerase, beta subunit n=1 Tax=Candidatus Scalindua japonica TaxID=1284222 RepID=A0A286U339_9BACT|nr:hypothetical protein [Candidatus Scalindua japonica]GAX62548.1 DNA-directed RNA polymerase, beta subunit [Candidatus Scalindua japonica]
MNFSHKNKRPVIASFKKILILSALATFLFGCSTTALNIKQSSDLNGKKILTGRFVFLHNDIPLGNSEGFTIFFKERSDKKLRAFKLDENGFVYIPLDQGQYYISSIEFRHSLGNFGFPVHQSSGINIDASDTVVNFGTMKINLKQNEASKVAYLTTYAYPYAGKFIPLSQKPELRITQIPEWNVIQKYILSKLDISPESIRDEVINFSEETETSFK